MSFPTFDPPGDIPNMDLDSIMANIEAIDPVVFHELIYYLDDEERTKKLNVLTYLRDNEPVLYQTLENSLRFYQSAFMMAGDASQALAMAYRRWRAAQNTLEKVHRINLEEELAKQVEEKKPAQRKKKRDRAPQGPELKEKMLKSVEAVADEIKTNANRDLFFSQEKFSPQFDLAPYTHFVKKDRKKWALRQVHDYGIWHTVYHCSGQWQAEELVASLTAQGQIAIIIKKLRCMEETLTFKVLCGAPK